MVVVANPVPQIVVAGCGKRVPGHFVDADIFWRCGLQSIEALLIPLKKNVHNWLVQNSPVQIIASRRRRFMLFIGHCLQHQWTAQGENVLIRYELN